MPQHLFLLLLLSCLILTPAWLWHLYWLHHCPPHSRVVALHTAVHRLLKPRTPLDCPACCLTSTLSSGVEPPPTPVRPWCEVKSCRGARHSGEHRWLRLSKPKVSVLRHHRCSHSCAGWGWQAWPCNRHQPKKGQEKTPDS